MTNRQILDWLATIFLAGLLVVAIRYLPQESSKGIASVIDGDSLRIGDKTIRLFGIDAPERRQTCTRSNGKRWPCGKSASGKLRALTAGQEVSCSIVDQDRYRRHVARCTGGGMNLNDEMVRSGFALALRSITYAYVGAERDARKARRGVWDGTMTPPWKWRKTHRKNRRR